MRITPSCIGSDAVPPPGPHHSPLLIIYPRSVGIVQNHITALLAPIGVFRSWLTAGSLGTHRAGCARPGVIHLDAFCSVLGVQALKSIKQNHRKIDRRLKVISASLIRSEYCLNRKSPYSMGVLYRKNLGHGFRVWIIFCTNGKKITRGRVDLERVFLRWEKAGVLASTTLTVKLDCQPIL